MRKEAAIHTDIGILGINHPISKNANTDIMRGPEDAILYKESKNEKDSSAPRENHELCDLYKLPKNISCPVRFEKSGLFFCRIKDDCPLKLV